MRFFTALTFVLLACQAWLSPAQAAAPPQGGKAMLIEGKKGADGKIKVIKQDSTVSDDVLASLLGRGSDSAGRTGGGRKLLALTQTCAETEVAAAVKAVNDLRTAAGVALLTCTNNIVSVQEQHAQEMAAAGALSTTGFSTRCTKSGYTSSCTELVAYQCGYSYPIPGDKGRAVINQWAANSTYKTRMTSTNYTKFGLGYATGTRTSSSGATFKCIYWSYMAIS